MKWLLILAMLAVPGAMLWARMRPRSRVGRLVTRRPARSSRATDMSRGQLLRGAAAFLLFGVVSFTVYAVMASLAVNGNRLSFESPFPVALAFSAAFVGGMALLVGLYLLVAGLMRRRGGADRADGLRTGRHLR